MAHSGRPPSTFRSLLPLCSSILIQEGRLVDKLPPESSFAKFAQALEDYELAVSKRKASLWGIYNPADFLVDADSDAMPRAKVHRLVSGKPAQAVSEGLLMVASAYLFLDIAVRLENPEVDATDTIAYPKHDSWIGKNTSLDRIKDLSSALAAFVKTKSIQNSNAPLPGTLDSAPPRILQLADEVFDIFASKKLINIVKNISLLAFCISVMFHGYIQFPDSASVSDILQFDRLTPAMKKSIENARLLLQKAPVFRKVFHQAVIYSPWLVLAGSEFANGGMCPEETLINATRFGNRWPPLVKDLNDDAWRIIFEVAEGPRSPWSAYHSLRDVAASYMARLKSDQLANAFYARASPSPYLPCLSYFAPRPASRIPASWPLPPAAAKLIRIVDAELPPVPSSGSRSSNHPASLPQQPDLLEFSSALETRYAPPSMGGPDHSSIQTDLQLQSPDLELRVDDVPASSPPANPANKSLPPTGGGELGPDLPARRPRAAAIAAGLKLAEATSQQPTTKAHPPAKKRRASTSILNRSPSPSTGQFADVLYQCAEIASRKAEEHTHLAAEVGVKIEALEGSPLPSSAKLPLNLDEEPERYSDTQNMVFQLWDATGQVHQCKPEIHTKSDYESWVWLYNAAVEHYTDVRGTGSRRPRFIDDPDHSVYRCMYDDEMATKSPRDIQALLQRGNIVAAKRDLLESRFEFDEETLYRLSDLSDPTDIQDQSIEVLDGDFQQRVRTGTLRDLYNSAQGPPEKRKSLNGLYFPNPHAGVTESAFASDVRAVRRTKREKGCLKSMCVADIRFGIVATAGAHHYIHIDNRGEGTFVKLLTGTKAWLSAALRNPADLYSTVLWSDRELDVRRLDLSKWTVEIILLRAGDTLWMSPANPHAVLTFDNAICEGGHFIPTSCLARSVAGLVHTFFRGKVITNIDHPSFQLRINSLACFFYNAYVVGDRTIADEGHLPALRTLEDLHHFVIFACGVELQHCVCPTSYAPTEDPTILRSLIERCISPDEALQTCDITAASESTRRQNVYGRGRTIATTRHILSYFVIADAAGRIIDNWKDYFIPTLAWFIHGLKDYYARTFAIEVQEATLQIDAQEFQTEDAKLDALAEALSEFPRPDHFAKRLQWAAQRWQELEEAVERLSVESASVTHFVRPPPPFTLVEIKEFKPATVIEDVLELGTTVGDTLFFTAHESLLETSGLPASDTLKNKTPPQSQLQSDRPRKKVKK